VDSPVKRVRTSRFDEQGKNMALDYEWHDFFGNLGVLLIVGSYFWLQIGRISGQSPVYSVINAVGAALVLVSLYFEFNLSAVLVESFWLAISLLGLFLGTKKGQMMALRSDSKPPAH
jgi:hypothetical protein